MASEDPLGRIISALPHDYMPNSAPDDRVASFIESSREYTLASMRILALIRQGLIQLTSEGADLLALTQGMGNARVEEQAQQFVEHVGVLGRYADDPMNRITDLMFKGDSENVLGGVEDVLNGEHS